MSRRDAFALMWLVGLVALGLTGCGSTPTAARPTARPATLTATATPSPTPTPTPRPFAARVNGDVIWLEEWRAETQRVLAAADELGLALDEAEAQARALRALVEETLLAQAAREQGLAPTAEEVEQRLAAWRAGFDSDAAREAYLAQLGYDEAGLRRALARAMAAARMRAAIAAQVPTRAEQVRARQIFVRTQEEAAAVLQYHQQGVKSPSYNTIVCHHHHQKYQR